jgi:hypothetical protein
VCALAKDQPHPKGEPVGLSKRASSSKAKKPKNSVTSRIDPAPLSGDGIGHTPHDSLSGAFACLADLSALPIIAGVAVIGFAKGAHEA